GSPSATGSDAAVSRPRLAFHPRPGRFFRSGGFAPRPPTRSLARFASSKSLLGKSHYVREARVLTARSLYVTASPSDSLLASSRNSAPLKNTQPNCDSRRQARDLTGRSLLAETSSPDPLFARLRDSAPLK